jgi:YidC/Oxa1 family membrane protein insertase
MQDQGRRLFLVAALCIGLFWVWQLMFPKKDDTAPKPGQGSGSAVAAATVGGVPATPDVIAYAPSSKADLGAAQKIELKFPDVVATFSSRGGELVGWQLTNPRYREDATKGELIPQMPSSGELGIAFARGSTYKLPAQTEWHGEKTSPTQVVYTLDTGDVTLTKTFDIVPDAYFVRCTISIKPKGDAHQRLVVSMYGYQDRKTDVTGSARIAPRVWQSSTDRDGSVVSTPVTDLLDRKEGGPRYETNFRWTGFEHPYILMGFAPHLTTAGVVEKHTYAEGGEGLMRTDIVFPDGTGPASYQVVGYLGPKSWEHLNRADAAAGFATHFRDVIDFGWFGFIGKPLLWLLVLFQGFIGNWGLAIVLLTVIVKLVTLPFVTKSMRSMKTMSLLAPQLKELNKKYGTDKQRIQVETMALYKQYGVNPLTGCLPMFLQMPIWIALYRMLSNAGELYRQPFIPGWINDLTAADPHYILPIVLCVAMFAQALLTPSAGDPSQKTQQQMMKYGMPLGFGVMSFWFPSGLTLYMLTNSLLTAVQSLYLNKYDAKTKAIEAQFKAKQDELAVKDVIKSAKAAPVASVATAEDDEVDAIVAAKPRPRPQQKKKAKKGRR